VTVTEIGAADVPWECCAHPGCHGVQAVAGACLAHLDEQQRVPVLAAIGRGRPIDVRGVAIGADLLATILAACPVDDCGRRVLNRARFDLVSFDADAAFARVVFSNEVCFDGARFAGEASFDSARFDGPARFARASFQGPASFDEASFGGQAWFGGARFSGIASFGRSEFTNLAWFSRADFETDAAFDGAVFRGDTTFDGTEFRCHTRFDGAGFLGEASLEKANFNHEPRYAGAAFSGKGGAPQAAVREAIWSGEALAPWRARVRGALIDIGLTAAPVAIAVVVGAILQGLLHYTGAVVALCGVGVVAALGFTVRSLVEQGRTGQTIGKRRLGICLVRERDGLPVGPARSLGRQALHLLDSLPVGIGWLRPLWNAKHQTFADTLLTTVVVNRRGWARVGSSRVPEAEGPPPGGG